MCIYSKFIGFSSIDVIRKVIGKKLIYEWEEERNINIGHCDDFEKMPKTKTIDEVKKKMY